MWMLALCALLIAVPVVAVGRGPQPAATTHVDPAPPPLSPPPPAKRGRTPPQGTSYPALGLARLWGDILLDVTAGLDTPTSVMALLATNAKVETTVVASWAPSTACAPLSPLPVRGRRPTDRTGRQGLADIGADYSMLQGGEVVVGLPRLVGSGHDPHLFVRFPAPSPCTSLRGLHRLTSEVSEWARANGLTLGTELAPDTVPTGFGYVGPASRLCSPPAREAARARKQRRVFVAVAEPEPAATSEPAAAFQPNGFAWPAVGRPDRSRPYHGDA